MEGRGRLTFFLDELLDEVEVLFGFVGDEVDDASGELGGGRARGRGVLACWDGHAGRLLLGI